MKDIFRKIFGFKKKKTVGIALGSGGLFGLSHVGVLKELERNKIPIDYIVGSSMGAIIGSYYSLNPNANSLDDLINKLKKWDLIKLIDISVPKTSLISGNKIRKFLEGVIGDKDFSDTKIPLKIVATDLEKGEEVILSEGKLIDAIMASISIPGIFPPVIIDKKILVDGGVINSTPTNVVSKMGADVIIGVDLTMKHILELKNPKIYQILMRSYEILRTQSTKFNLNGNKDEIIIKPNLDKLSKIRLNELNKFIEEGEKETEKFIPRIKEHLFS